MGLAGSFGCIVNNITDCVGNLLLVGVLARNWGEIDAGSAEQCDFLRPVRLTNAVRLSAMVECFRIGGLVSMELHRPSNLIAINKLFAIVANEPLICPMTLPTANFDRSPFEISLVFPTPLSPSVSHPPMPCTSVDHREIVMEGSPVAVSTCACASS